MCGSTCKASRPAAPSGRAIPLRAAGGLAVLAAALAPLVGCTSTHRGSCSVPQTVLVPFAAAGIEDRSAEYGGLFCSSLQHIGSEGGPWDDCGRYIQTPGLIDPDLPPLATNHRILVVSGILAKCFSPKLQAFSDALAHLRDTHGVEGEQFEVSGLGSSEYNAALIAARLRAGTGAGSKKYIAVGYSKGAIDLMVALAAYPEVREAVAALVTVAAPVGGSPAADMIPESFIRLLGKSALERCDEGDGGGLASLRRPVRQDFLRAHPEHVVPTYALVAVSDKETTSRGLAPFWKELSSFSSDEDGCVIASDAVAPGARFLGTLKGDHWAVAMPFEIHGSSAMRSLVDHNHFPRTALLEAALRIVTRDLETAAPPQQ